VVPLPEGLDPADLLARDGAEAVAALVDRSEPFVSSRRAHPGGERPLDGRGPRPRDDRGAAGAGGRAAQRAARGARPDGRGAPRAAGAAGGDARGVDRAGQRLAAFGRERPGSGRDYRRGAGRPGQATEQSFLAACLALRGRQGRARRDARRGPLHERAGAPHGAAPAEHGTTRRPAWTATRTLRPSWGCCGAGSPPSRSRRSAGDRALPARAAPARPGDRRRGRDQHAEIGALAEERERVRHQLQDLLGEAAGE